MKNKKIIIILAIIFIAIAGFSAWYIYRDLKTTNQESSKVRPLENLENNQISPEEQQAAAARKEEEIKKQMPDLDKEIVVKVNLSEEQKNRAISEIKIITAVLKTDYDRLEDWLNLGLWRKTIGDYEGAAQAWKFTAIIRPNNPVAFHNLGDLYSQFLPDFPEAEKYYLAAIEKDTAHGAFFYSKLYEFYLYYYKKPDLAEKTLLDGLKNNPTNAYLQSLLDGFRQNKK